MPVAGWGGEGARGRGEGFYGKVHWGEGSILVGRESAVAGSVVGAIPRGGGVALRHGATVLTYDDLLDRAARLAGHLRAHGVGPGVPVGLLLAPGGHYAVALLAVLTAGATAVPFDPTQPVHRRRLQHAAAEPALTIVDSTTGADGPVVDLDDPLWMRAAPLTAAAPGPDDPAYLLFTSGSTGTPKGVRLPYRALANLLAWQHRTAPVGAGTRTLQFAPVTFDVSIQELLSTWVGGGELVVLDGHRRPDVEFLGRFCADEGVGRVFLPFAALQPLSDWVAHAGLRLPRLTEIVTAGEQPVVTEALESFVRLCAPGASLTNQYGPTETHVVTAAVYRGDPAGWPRLPSAGTPVDNATVAILDPAGAVVPVGTEGEVCVAGAPVGLGYLGPDPGGFGQLSTLPDDARRSGPDGRWAYRTGDRGRVDDGRLWLLGRADGQVKIGGHRIELPEIEAVAAAVAPVREVAAVALGPGGADRRLALFLVPGVGTTIDAGAVRRSLAERLPAAAVPSQISVLDALPRTASGKIDRLRLGAGAPTVSPSTSEPSAVIAGILAAALGVSTLDCDESFLDRGGTSLAAMVAVARLTRALHATPPIDRILSTATVADLAADLAAGRWAAVAPTPPADPPLGPVTPTGIQQELWAATELGHPTAYNVVVALDAQRHLDRPRLHRTLHDIVTAHPALRSLLCFVRDEPVLRFPADWRLDLPVEPAVDDVVAARIETDFAERGFRLGRDLPLRALLLRLPRHDRLLLAVHHHVIDDDGIALLLAELAGHRSPPEPEAAARIVDDPADRAYWERALAGVTDDMVTWLQCPGEPPRGEATYLTVSLERMPTPPRGVTLFAWLLATFAHAARDGGAPADLMLGTVTSRRDPLADAHAMGCFTGLLPLRVRVLDRNEATAAAVHRGVVEALGHRQFAYGDLGRPVVAATVGLERPEGRRIRLGGVPARVRTVRPSGTPFPLSAALRPYADGPPVLELTVDESRYPIPTAHTLLKTWHSHLTRPT